MTNWAVHRYRRTTLVAVFCAAILWGIGFSRVVVFDLTWVLAAGALMVCVIRRQELAAFMAVMLLGVCVGGLQGTSYMQRLAVNEGFFNQKVTIIGQAAADASYGRQKQLTFDVNSARVVGLDGTPGSELAGKIGVSGFGENMVFRGDTLIVTGKLRPGTGAKQGWMSFARFTAVERDNSWVEKIRKSFGAGMLTALPEPLGSFAMGLLIGQRSSLPSETYDDLLKVGLVHIIAVSGYNLTIILRACWKLLGNRSKYQTLIVSVTLMGTFLLITGASASIVRASIVSGLGLLAWYYGRNFRPVTLILLAAAITSMAYPIYVWSDLGWYLSFLAFYGVLVLAPQIRYRLVPERFRESTLLGIAVESLCAEVMTLPLVLYIFGQMSHISLLANVVIAVFVPFAMLLTVIAGLAGTFLPIVVGWFAWPAVMLLTYMLDMAHILASIPYIFQENIGFSLLAMIGMYCLVLGINLVLYSRLRQNRAIVTALREEHTLLKLSGNTSDKQAAQST